MLTPRFAPRPGPAQLCLAAWAEANVAMCFQGHILYLLQPGGETFWAEGNSNCRLLLSTEQRRFCQWHKGARAAAGDNIWDNIWDSIWEKQLWRHLGTSGHNIWGQHVGQHLRETAVQTSGEKSYSRETVGDIWKENLFPEELWETHGDKSYSKRSCGRLEWRTAAEEPLWPPQPPPLCDSRGAQAQFFPISHVCTCCRWLRSCFM